MHWNWDKLLGYMYWDGTYTCLDSIANNVRLTDNTKWMDIQTTTADMFNINFHLIDTMNYQCENVTDMSCAMEVEQKYWMWLLRCDG